MGITLCKPLGRRTGGEDRRVNYFAAGTSSSLPPIYGCNTPAAGAAGDPDFNFLRPK